MKEEIEMCMQIWRVKDVSLTEYCTEHCTQTDTGYNDDNLQTDPVPLVTACLKAANHKG